MPGHYKNQPVRTRTVVVIFIYYPISCRLAALTLGNGAVKVSPLIIKITIKEFLTSTFCEG